MRHIDTNDFGVQGSLAGRAGIVVGAASGIGRAIASGLARLGAQLLLVDRSEDARVLGQDLDSKVLLGDVSTEDTADAIAHEASEQFGAPDFLVNCAGIQSRSSVLDLSENDWRKLEDTNWAGLRRVSVRTARLMIDADQTGSIVNVTSSSVASVTLGIIPYSVTKAAVTQLTRGLAAELGPAGIRVNAIAPGYVRTAMTREILEDPDSLQTLGPRIPLGHVAEPEDMVGPVVFLVSDAARYVTGAVIPVDGGFTLGAYAVGRPIH